MAPATNAALLVIAVGRMTRERADAELGELGLALRHVSALGHLARRPGLYYSELARRAGITAQSMQATLHQLEQDGAIERCTPPGRGRRAKLQITSSGRAVLGQARAVMDGIDRGFLDVLAKAPTKHSPHCSSTSSSTRPQHYVGDRTPRPVPALRR